MDKYSFKDRETDPVENYGNESNRIQHSETPKMRMPFIRIFRGISAASPLEWINTHSKIEGRFLWISMVTFITVSYIPGFSTGEIVRMGM